MMNKTGFGFLLILGFLTFRIFSAEPAAEKAVAQSASTLSGIEAGQIEVQISTTAEGVPMPVIAGKTNLPDGATLLVNLRRREGNFLAQDAVTVAGSAFRAGPFSARGAPLPPGTYEVSVSMSIARLQSASVQTVIGDKGQNLKGPYVKGSSTDSSGNYVSYEFPLIIPGDGAQGLPREWKSITNDFCTALQAGGSCREFDMRVDTERKLERKFGYKIRGEPGTDVSGICMKALTDFKGSPADCKRAWEDYGCQGRKHARLLQESYLAGRARTLCEY